MTQKDFFPTVGGRSRKQGKAVTWDFGYRPDPAATEAFVAGLPRPTFAEAAPDCMAQADPSKDALLYQACVKVTGANLPAHKQSIGCCTSEGWSYGVDVRQCVDAALGGAVEYKPISHAVFYGLGRARANMLGSGDGCYGSAMAEAATKDGCVTNEDARDSGTDDTLAAEYGRRGVPSELKRLAGQHLCRTVTLVSSADEGMAALQSGYPVPVCSGQGFTMTRDADGFCKARGSWAHCMCIVAYRADKRGFLIVQSWGQNTPDGPCVLGQPDNSFWAEWATVDRMLKEKDSFAVSAFDGFPARTIPWSF